MKNTKRMDDNFQDCITDIYGDMFDIKLYKAKYCVKEVRVGFLDSTINPIYITFNKITKEWVIRQLDERLNEKTIKAWVSGRKKS